MRARKREEKILEKEKREEGKKRHRRETELTGGAKGRKGRVG
jgi:hypothetical protein